MTISSDENLTLAEAIAKHLGLKWHDTQDPRDADLIDAAYEALMVLDRRGRLKPRHGEGVNQK